MKETITAIVTLAGLFFSLCCALLLEELLFGGIFRLFFGSRRLCPQPEQARQFGPAGTVNEVGHRGTA